MLQKEATTPGEGKILDGCITCPWHGYQYLPDTGASPPPFVEKVPTFNVRVRNGRVWIHLQRNLRGTRAEPAVIDAQSRVERQGDLLILRADPATCRRLAD